MSQQKLEDILKQGIYGSPQIRPDEKKLFLSTYSERVYLALTKSQVRHKVIYAKAEQTMQAKKDAHLYINGGLNYQYYSKYIQSANKNSIPFTIVNDGQNSPLGIVLASERSAVNNEDHMFINDDLYKDDMGD
ncbi:YueI family protein [Salipaludibacillus aurantiacus]|uniref:Uncharacterized protein YueI n=1 Tax=Salipaludibacillus aurantiacus TaxID=1601833 RepID=A0A1H9R726_9BACI|nr:YueI family protein [Salipaludibacillus aurantiacus]SER68544.1 Uncharacterized protein YueI [Salipaludibacillus aurantiacus]